MPNENKIPSLTRNKKEGKWNESSKLSRKNFKTENV